MNYNQHLTLTQAGLACVIQAPAHSLQAKITQIAVGDVGWSADDTATALRSEKLRVSISGGQHIDGQQLRITATLSGEDDILIREVGIYLANGVLLAIWSSTDHILVHKTAGVDVLLSLDLKLNALPAGIVLIDGKGGFNLPQATQNTAGLLRLATNEEAKQRQSSDIVVTPAQLGTALIESGVPSGTIMAYAGQTIPPYWMLCDGSALLITDYPLLYDAIGTQFGMIDNSDGITTHFQLPDLRGEFIRGFDAGRDIDVEREFGSYQEDAFKQHSHKVQAFRQGNADPGSRAGTQQTGLVEDATNYGFEKTPFVSETGLTETRPRNVALHYIIKT